MLYVYNTTLYKDTSTVIGASASNATDLSDFNANYNAQVLKVNSLSLAENSVELVKTYTQFKALVASPLTWGDVKCIEEGNKINLYIISNDAL